MADLLSYVPQLVFDDCLAQQEEHPVEAGPLPAWKPRYKAFWGAVIFCDVSGFTKLSERLAAEAEREAEGAEKLVAYLNTYFGRLLDIVKSHGADVIKFAGDALMACWPQRDGESTGLTVLRAVQASAAIEQHMNIDDDETPYLHMGISAGPLFLLQVGGTFNRSECVLVGPPLLQLSDAVPAASPKFSVLSPEAWALLPADSVLAEPVTAKAEVVGSEASAPGPDAAATSTTRSLMRLTAVVNGPPPVALLPPSLETLNEHGMSLLLRFVPGSIKAAVAEGQQAWLGGSRKVSVMFIHIKDIDMSVGDCLPAVHSAVLAVQEAVYKYEGSINKILLDDKGFLLLAGFGLPPLSHEDDALRAVLSALRVQAKLKALGMRCDVGVTTGSVFCGIVGSDDRREYTMMGDTVNTAARFMASAKGSVYVDEATVAACPPDSMQFDELAPRAFKGKAGLLKVFQPSRKRLRIIKSRRPNKLVRSLETMKRSKACPLIGRQKESSLIASLLSSLKRNDFAGKPGPVVVFEGERGIGKGRVLEEANRLSAKSRFVVFTGRGDAMAVSSLLHPWAPVFRKLLRLPRERESDADSIALYRQTAHDTLDRILPPDLVPWAAILNPLLDPIAFDPCAELAAASEKDVLAMTLDLLPRFFVPLFTARARAGVLVLQDYNLFDPPSRALLTSIASTPDLKLGIFLSSTLADADPPPDYAALVALPSTQVIELKALSSTAIAKLVASRLGVKALPPQVIELVVDKCGGNPFFAQELGTALLDSGVLARSPDGNSVVIVDEESLSLNTANVNLPTALRGVITSRIDKLRPAHLRLLKVTAAMGSNITVSVVHDVFAILDAGSPAAVPQSEDALEEGLDRLTALAFLNRLDDTGGYEFKTALTQDVVYSLMLTSQQHAVHAAIAQYYERVAEADSVAVEALAFHWRHADTSDLVIANKAIRYLEQAAMAALDQSNPRRALAHLQSALALYSSSASASAAPDGPASESDAMMATVKVLLLRVAAMASLQIGHLTRARSYAIQALAILGQDARDGESLESLMARVDAATDLIKSSTLPDAAPDAYTTVDELRFRDELDEGLVSTGTLKKRQKYGTLKRSFSEFLQNKERLNSSFSSPGNSSLDWASTDEFASFSTLDEFRFSALDDDAAFDTDGLDDDDAYLSASDTLAGPSSTLPPVSSPLRTASAAAVIDSSSDDPDLAAPPAPTSACTADSAADSASASGDASDSDSASASSSSTSTSSSTADPSAVKLQPIANDTAPAPPPANGANNAPSDPPPDEKGSGGGCCTLQ